MKRLQSVMEIFMTLMSFEIESVELDHLNLSVNDEAALIEILFQMQKILENYPFENSFQWLFLLSKFWHLEKCRRLFITDITEEQFLTESLCEKLAKFSDIDGPEAHLRLELLIYRLEWSVLTDGKVSKYAKRLQKSIADIFPVETAKQSKLNFTENAKQVLHRILPIAFHSSEKYVSKGECLDFSVSAEFIIET